MTSGLMLDAFREVVVVDTEFTIVAGERPEPVCLVAHELRSGRRFRIFEDQFGSAPPYATGPDALFVAFYASAELGVYRVLGWSRPERVLDLFVEFRNHTNGLPTPAGSSLLGALAHGITRGAEFEERFGPRFVIRGMPPRGRRPPGCLICAIWRMPEFRGKP
jgi:hypothetical protein